MLDKIAPAVAALLISGGAFAAPTVLLNDDFNSENGGVGHGEFSAFANFSAANVDLLAPGYFYTLCQSAGGSTPCIDMEGSGNGAMTTKTAFDLSPGTVTMQFDLAGDQRGASGNKVTVSLVTITDQTLFTEDFSLASSTHFTTFSRTVTLGTPQTARLRFLSSGPADSFGMLLDNVVLSADVAAVPEPETYALMLAGLLVVGATARRRVG